MGQDFTIKVREQDFTFIASADHDMSVSAVKLLQGEINKVQDEGAMANAPDIVIILVASLNISKKYMESKKRHDLWSRAISEKSGRLLKSLQDAVS